MKCIAIAASCLIALAAALPVVFSQEEIAIYNLISRANDPRTVWATCTLPTCADYAEITFGDMSPVGGARYHLNDVLNDGNVHSWVLETHPKWVDNGYIQGWYHDPVYVPASGAKLRVLVGFRQGAGAGRATVQINLVVPGSSPPTLIPLLNQEIAYSDGVREFTVDLPPETRGNAYEIALIAMAGETSAQDWVAWSRIWITARVGSVSTTTSTTTVRQTSTTTQTTTATTTIAMGTTATVTQTTAVTRVETLPTTITQTVQSPTTRVETTTQTLTNTVTQIQPTVIVQTVTAQGGLTSRCLIATAAFGSELDPSVKMLRQFRDGFVLQTFSGKTFMDVFNAFYYSWSPAVAEAEYANQGFRTMIKYSIYPLLGVLHLSQAAATPLTPVNPELAVLVAGLTASFLLGVVYLSIPLMAVRMFLKVRTGIRVRHVLLMLVGALCLFAAALTLYHPLMMAVASSAVVLTTLFIGAYSPTILISRASGRKT
ncbi:MAG: CFI-box-CTERM domain-containing protein [Candidatus Caldarchaeum sp.]